MQGFKSVAAGPVKGLSGKENGMSTLQKMPLMYNFFHYILHLNGKSFAQLFEGLINIETYFNKNTVFVQYQVS